MKKKEKRGDTTPMDEWEDILWVDDMPVYARKKRGRGGLTSKKKMIKFLNAKGQ